MKMNFTLVVCVCPCYHLMLNELDSRDTMDYFNLKSPAHLALAHKIFYFLKNQNISAYLMAFVLKFDFLRIFTYSNSILARNPYFSNLFLPSALKHLL